MRVHFEIVDKGMKRAQRMVSRPRLKLLLGVLPGDADARHPSGEPVGKIAAVHEYGLGGNPVRSWMRDWFDENAEDILRQLSTDTLRIIFGQPPEDERFSLERRGHQYRRSMVERIEFGNVFERLKKGTIRQKGGLDTPLIDTEFFIDSIRYRVE